MATVDNLTTGLVVGMVTGMVRRDGCVNYHIRYHEILMTSLRDNNRLFEKKRKNENLKIFEIISIEIYVNFREIS